MAGWESEWRGAVRLRPIILRCLYAVDGTLKPKRQLTFHGGQQSASSPNCVAVASRYLTFSVRASQPRTPVKTQTCRMAQQHNITAVRVIQLLVTLTRSPAESMQEYFPGRKDVIVTYTFLRVILIAVAILIAIIL